MGRPTAAALHLLVMVVAIIVGVDVLFFREEIRGRGWRSTSASSCFLAFYFRFLKRS